MYCYSRYKIKNVIKVSSLSVVRQLISYFWQFRSGYFVFRSSVKAVLSQYCMGFMLGDPNLYRAFSCLYRTCIMLFHACTVLFCTCIVLVLHLHRTCTALAPYFCHLTSYFIILLSHFNPSVFR